MNRVLVVTAVEAERQAVLAGLGEPPRHCRALGGAEVDVLAVGVGTAAAAAATARALTLAETARLPYEAVICAGIAGGINAPVAGIVLSNRSVAADLGAQSADGFISLDALGFGSNSVSADPALLEQLTAALPHATVGPVLTVATVTGTADGLDELVARHPDAVAEAMEGFGVATAAAQAGAAFLELRTISNPVGPRDRRAWRIEEALKTLTAGFVIIRGND